MRAFIAATAMAMCTATVPLAAHAQTVQPEAASGLIFELKPEQFNARLASAVQSSGLSGPVVRPEGITKSKFASIYRWQLDALTSMNGTVDNETGRMMAAQLITKGDGSTESGLRALAMAASFFAAAKGPAVKQAEKKAAADVVLTLIERLQARKNTFQEVSLDDGQILYSANQTRGAGTWFTVEPSGL